MDTELLNMLDQLRKIEIARMKEVIIPKQLMTILDQEELRETIYLNANNLEVYKLKNISDKCNKCNRAPKYLTTDSNKLFCWLHSIE